MDSASLLNLWNYISGLSLSYDNRKWLSDKLIDAQKTENRIVPVPTLMDNVKYLSGKFDIPDNIDIKAVKADYLLDKYIN